GDAGTACRRDAARCRRARAAAGVASPRPRARARGRPRGRSPSTRGFSWGARYNSRQLHLPRKAVSQPLITLATVRRALRGHWGPLAGLDDLAPVTAVLPPGVVRPFVFALSRRPALRPNDEVQHGFWVPLDRLAEPGVRREVTLTVRGAERTLPAYVVGDEVIWGMTERILTPFLERVAGSA